MTGPGGSRAEDLLARLREGPAADARARFSALDAGERVSVLAALREETDRRFGRVLETFVPGKSFISLSVTGARCDLGCKHCNKKYLGGMVPAETPERMEQVLLDLHARGGKGALISGGSSVDGIVELHDFLPVLADVKKRTTLTLNMHVGLIPPTAARELHRTGVDVISMDLAGDDRTIQEIYGLDKTTRDYQRVLNGLFDAGFTREQVVPHVCIGLYKGQLAGECEVLDWLTAFDPALVVFIVLIPPARATGVSFEHVSPADVASVIATARARFPGTGISLGCMRPGGRARVATDVAAFEAGITRVALPTRALLTHVMDKGYHVERVDTCCAVAPRRP